MKRHLVICWLIALFPMAAPRPAVADEASWIFRPSYYSHSPETGDRVVQYQEEQPVYARVDPTYQESGYRHIESNIQVGNSADHFHVVQTWGQGDQIRPYGEWQFPFRAGATPYGPWGNPQGPWTLPFDSWRNPYGLGQLPRGPWQFGPGFGPVDGSGRGGNGARFPATPFGAGAVPGG
jgi:hypothetical protein